MKNTHKTLIALTVSLCALPAFAHSSFSTTSVNVQASHQVGWSNGKYVSIQYGQSHHTARPVKMVPPPRHFYSTHSHRPPHAKPQARPNHPRPGGGHGHPQPPHRR